MTVPQVGKRPTLTVLSQLGRIAMLALVVLLIRREYASRTDQHSTQRETTPPLRAVQQLFPDAAVSGPFDAELRRWRVFDANEQIVGSLLQSSPDGDRSIGFSGPTNLLIALDSDERIAGLTILTSGDTHDHVRAVEEDSRFLQAFDDLSARDLLAADVDAVSGATLTSDAIRGAIVLRLTGSMPAPRFAEPIPLADVRTLFPEVARITQPSQNGRIEVFDKQGNRLGDLLRTSPAADHLLGYGGPTEALVALDLAGQVLGVAIGRHYLCTFDNEPYVSYVREDEYFHNLFNAKTVAKLGALDLEEAQIDGVSGATMTSMAVAEGIVAAAKAETQRKESTARRASRRRATVFHATMTAALVGAALAWKRLPQPWHRFARVALLLAAIGYLGLWRGELLSQAMLVGWAQSGIPLGAATSFVVLAGAALLIPAAKGDNVYCHQLCPHGALQQLVKNRIPWQVRMGRRRARWLRLIPPLLLVLCVVIAMAQLPLSLVNLEPFDAWLFPMAAIASVVIAVVGIVASLFTPMAYCRYGCPTGALLEAIRFHRRGALKRANDWLPTALLITAVVLSLI